MPAAIMHWLPTINATLNALAGALALLAFIAIRRRNWRLHAGLMIAALATSAAFLTCYIIHHYLRVSQGLGLTRFPPSSWRPVYLVLLTSHTILAIVILPLIAVTVRHTVARRWSSHRRIARPTFWMWLYVSATGVVVYLMLYHLAAALRAA